MKRFSRKLTALALSAALTAQLLPTAVLAASYQDSPAQLPEVLELNGDNHIKVTASQKTGGFLIDTKDGDKLTQRDDNKFLLYPDDYYNTSFTSFRITDGAGTTKDYIFGREYGFLGMNSVMKSVDVVGNKIISIWALGDLEFTQTLTLLNVESSFHGMVNIAYSVKNNSSENYDIQARILMDTALGYQDYGYYELTNADGGYDQVTYEQVLDNTNGAAYDSVFFAYNDPYTPTVRAYTVNDPDSTPSKIAIGHWSNLAGSVFDFLPDETLNFTNPYNVEHLTADSAYALYYDLDTVAAGGSAALSTNYGIYSNVTADLGDSLSLNITQAPPSMEIPEGADLADENLAYVGDGKFELGFQLQNLSEYDIEDAEIQIIPELNVDVLDESGNVVDYESNTMATRYHSIAANKLNAHGNGAYTVSLKAAPAAPTFYRKIDIAVVVEGETLITKSVYVYCPGTGSGSISVTATSPSIVYKEGDQTLLMSGSGFSALADKSMYTVALTSQHSDQSILINPTDMNVNVADNVMTLPFSSAEELTLGDWDITIDWNDPDVEDIHTTAMTFAVTDDQRYMANSYGVVTIERDGVTGDDRNTYSIQAYSNEADYIEAWQYDGPATGAETRVVLEFRGIFTVIKDDDGNITQVSGLSNKTVKGAVQNTMTISNCLDVEDGTLTLTDEDDTINIDINARVYTTGARTPVWNGVCAITSFEDGGANELILYDEDGNVMSNVENTVADSNAITLIWPSAAGTFQTIGGVLMELRYCQFGQIATERVESMNEGTERARVIAFGAQFSTDMLVPSSIVTTSMEKSAMEKQMYDMTVNPGGYTADDLRKVQDDYASAQERFQEAANGSLGLYAHDVLFGGGFIGFNCSLEVGLPSYFEGMPSIDGVLNLKVINEEWAVGVEGSADLGVFMMEGSLKLASYNGIPVPDELYFFVGGFTPGINPDCHGIFWIRGAGGGVSDLYDTIFPVSSVPPLTLLLSGQFAIFQTMSARADLSLSLRGYSVELSDIGIVMGTSTLEVIESMLLECYWYPELHIYGGIQLNILDAIIGTGYLVLEEDSSNYSYFYEGYASCGLQIPEKIPVVGGIELGSVGMGINNERMFGAAQVLKVDFGVLYNWGGEVEFRFGKYDVVGPSYDGFTAASDATPMLLMSNEPVAIATLASDQAHTITLKDYNVGNDYIVTVTYVASSEAEAQTIANTMTVTNGGVNMAEGWTWAAADDSDVSDADAMLRCTESDGVYKATLTFSVTDQDDFNKTWEVNTSVDSVVEQYEVARMADLKTAVLNETEKSVAITGDMDDFSTLSVYAKDATNMRYLLAEVAATEESNPLTGESHTLTFDEAYLKVLPSGIYTIEAMATTKNQTSNPVVTATGTFTHQNQKQPAVPTINGIDLGGDYTLDVTTDTPDPKADGYLATIYEVVNGELLPTDFAGLYLKIPQEGNTLTLGGQFQQQRAETDADNNVLLDSDGNPINKLVTLGLEADKTYRVGLKACANLDDTDTLQGQIKSPEVFSGDVLMKAPIDTAPTLSIDGATPLTSPTSIDPDVTYPTVNTSDLSIAIDAPAAIGNTKYKLDGGAFVTLDHFASIDLADLAAGTHRLTMLGEYTTGDAFHTDYVFVVDTVAPKLSLSTYGGGGFYTGDSITVTGLTEAGTTLSVLIEGKPVTPTSTTIAADGTFSVTIPLATDLAYQYVTLSATDGVGNQSESLPIPMTNQAFFANADDMMLLLNGKDITDTVVPAADAVGTLSVGVDADGTIITLNDDSAVMTYGITYNVMAMDGSASINQKALTASSDVNGMVTAQVDGLTLAAVLGGNVTTEGDDSTGGSSGGSSSGGSGSSGGSSNRNPFVDVDDDAYYADAVNWAVKKGITSGTSATTFSPEWICSRAEAVTFLWRAAGKPKSTIENPFTDAEVGSYYYNAMLWAIEKGITVGTSDTTFSPDMDCSRAQIVTFLYRLAGEGKVDGSNVFNDVGLDAYYYLSVLWAAHNSITEGTGNGAFSPDWDCTRGQIVTFLYRYMG